MPPSILLLAPANSIHTVRWANALCEAGLEITVASCSDHSPTTQNPLSGKVRFVPLPHASPAGYYTNMVAVRRLVRSRRFDTVHAHYASGYGTVLSFIPHGKKILSVWGADVYEFPFRSWIHKFILGRNLKSADVVLSTSHSMAEHTRRHFPFVDKAPVVPFGVDTERFRPSGRASRLTPESHSPIQIGLCKALEAKYGVDILIRAFALVRKNFHDRPIELKIVGRGSQRAALEEEVNALGIGGEVTFLGPIPNHQVPAFLDSLDIFCCLSVEDSESFGVAVVEAMAMGLPVVVSDVSGFAEVVVNGESGLIVSRRNAHEAASALESLFREGQRAASLGENARKRVLENYDWEKNVAAMVEIYRKISAGDGRLEV